MDQPEVFRPYTSYLYAALAWTLLTGLLWADSVYADSQQLASNVVLGTGATYLIYLLFIRPRVRIFDDRIEIRNPISDHRVGWQDVQAIDTKYTMSVRVGGKNIHAWAAPAQGRYHARRVHPSDARHLRVAEGTLIPAGDSPRAHSGVASHLARLRYERFTGESTVATTHRRNYLHAALPVALVAVGILL